MEEWKEYKLGDLCNIFTGKKDVNQTTPDGCYPFFSCAPTPYKSNDYIHDGKAVIVAGNGSFTGRVSYYIGKFDLYQRTYACTPNVDTFDFIYLYYYLKAFFEPKFMGGTRGSSIPYIVKGDLSNFIICLPSIIQQERIASILKSLDDKIEVNRRINDNLEQQAQALFKSWFVDFEPFRDKPFVESELGMIPEGWRVEVLGNLIDIKYGKDHKKLGNGPYPVYGSGGHMRSVEKYLFEGESVLIPRKGTLNNVMYVNEFFWTVDTMFYSIPKIKNIILFSYIYLCNKDLFSMNAGSAVPSMTTQLLNNMKIVMPTPDILEKFNNSVSSMYDRIKHNNKENSLLSQLRDTLLPRLMSGELEIQDIEESL